MTHLIPFPRVRPPCVRLPRVRQRGSLLLAVGCLVFAGTLGSPARAIAPVAEHDLLKIPALPSAMASQSLILAVTTAGDRLVAVGERGIIITSDDHGESWKQAVVPVSVTLLAACFPVPGQGWAVGHDGVVLHSDDGGRSWVKQFDGNQSNVLMQADARERLARLRSLADAPAQAIEAAENAIDDTLAAAKFGPSHPLLGVWFANPTDGIVVGSYGQIFRTRDGGRTWASLGLRLNNAEGLHYNAITAIGSQAIVVVGEGGRVYRSLDGGDSWSQHEIGGKGALLGVRTLPSEEHGQILIAYGFGGRAFRSDDQGETWRPLVSGTSKSVVDAALLDGHLLLVDAGGALLQGDPDGSAFSVRGNLPQGMVEGMMPLNGDRLLLTGMGGIRVTDLNHLQK